MSTNALLLTGLSLPSPINSIEAYIQRVNQIAVLNAEDELALANRWYYQEDTLAARQLVLGHLRFVVHLARGYLGYGLALADLIQEGNIGLMKAIKRFDPTVGVRLVTFAVHWIKAEMNDFVVRNWRIVRVATTKAQRKLFFKLRSAKKRLGWFTEEELQHVANELQVNPKEVREMELRLQAQDAAFDGDTEKDSQDEDYQVVPADYLLDENSDPAEHYEQWQIKQKQYFALQSIWKTLTERERAIVQKRVLADDQDKATLHELAAQYAISAERVRQIEHSALKKLQKNISLELLGNTQH